MRQLAYLLPLFRPYRRRLVLGVGAILGAALMGLAGPILVGRAIDALWIDLSWRTLTFYAGLLVGITVVQGTFSYLQRMILVAMSRDIETDLRDRYFGHLTRLSQSFFQRGRTGDLMARATNDLEAVRQVCGPAVMYGSNTVFTSLGALLLMARIHLGLTAVALATLPLVALATKVFAQRIHHLFERVQDQFSEVSTHVQENLAGLRVVRAYAREEHEEERFGRQSREYVERNRRLARWQAAFRPVLQLLVGIGFATVLWYGGVLVWRETLTVGDLVTFQLFLGRLIWPMIAIGWVINLVQRGSASLGRMRRVLDSEPEVVDEEPLVRPEKLDGALECRGLDFAYGADGPRVLQGIRFDVTAGTTVALVGRTGSGKSTLLSLVPRLVNPPPGTLFLDGVDVRRLPLETLRGAVGLVPQETFLFSATVGENIAVGRPEASREELLEAARLAGLEEDLESFPRGLDTVVGERGITLSGGQKQRVALARALIRHPRVLLLDDCLSAVDTRTEERILTHLEEVFVGRTVVIVSHRISTVRGADLILVLEEGLITERGTHDQLLAADGLYADLHRRQQLEEELAAAS